MSTKLKALGLGLLAVMAASVFAVNASATVGGHFTNDAVNGHAIITGTEATGTVHSIRLLKEGGAEGETIICHNSSYTGTINAATVQSVTITPAVSNCTTTGGSTPYDIDENGCTFTLTSGKIGETHHTLDVLCPIGKATEITHPNCTMRMPSQTVRGLTYTTTVEDNKHAFTINVTVKGFTAHYEAGVCVFLGTTQKFEMNGSITSKATNTEGIPVNITETTG